MDLSQLEIRLARSENLPVLPEVVINVLSLLDQPSVRAKDVEKAIERDAGIAAKVLRVANSPYYFGANAPTVSRAISVLGLNAVRSLVVSVGFRQSATDSVQCPNFDKGAFWRHSLAVGIGGRILGKIACPMSAEQLYTAGLLHDIGVLVLDRFSPDDLEEAINISKIDKVSLIDAEKRVMGFDHADVGQLLAKTWKLPKMMANAVAYQNLPLLDLETPQTTCAVAAANILANRLELPLEQNSTETEIPADVAATLGVPVEQFDAIGAVVLKELERAQESLAPNKIAA